MEMVREGGGCRGVERVLLLGVLLPDVLWQLCHMRLLKKTQCVCECVCSALIEVTSHTSYLAHSHS